MCYKLMILNGLGCVLAFDVLVSIAPLVSLSIVKNRFMETANVFCIFGGFVFFCAMYLWRFCERKAWDDAATDQCGSQEWGEDRRGRHIVLLPHDVQTLFFVCVASLEDDMYRSTIANVIRFLQ